MKDFLRQLCRKVGIYTTRTWRLGVDVELDLSRLSLGAPLRTIFDVGANCGQSASRFAKAFPSADRICSFEPVPGSFALLRERVKFIPQVRIFNCALGDVAGTIRINLTPSAGGNSARSIASSTGCVQAPIDTLDSFCDSHRIDMIDLLKIDVEGFELPVLRGANRLLSSGKVRYIYAECVFAPNTDMPHTSFFDIHDFLSDRGFCFISYYAESFDLRLGCALGNVLYAFRKQLPAHVPGPVRNIA